jgi:hypothetical protein
MPGFWYWFAVGANLGAMVLSILTVYRVHRRFKRLHTEYHALLTYVRHANGLTEVRWTHAPNGDVTMEATMDLSVKCAVERTSVQ